ncbi:DDE-type integrase/transposase/recombinase [Myxococcota bacterium]
MQRTHRRAHQTYDHRIREAIAFTGNPHLHGNAPIPISTRRTWASGRIGPVVSSTEADLQAYKLLDELDRLKRRVKQQAAIIGLLVRLLRIRGGKLDAERLPDGAHKSTVLHAVASASRVLALSVVLRIVGLSSSRYHAWQRKEQGCGLDDESSCPRLFPTKLTREEVSTMRDFVESEDYRHIAIQNLALLGQRLGKVFAVASTWYKTIRAHGWKRPRKRLHPDKPRNGLKATRPNQFWHTDATVIRLTTGIRIYLQAVIDNFSRRILAWRVTEKLSCETTRELLIEASTNLSAVEGNPDVVVVTDGGSENFGDVNSLLDDSHWLERVVAQAEIIFSNSQIEAWWRELKHRWLFLHLLDNVDAVRSLVAFYVAQHNEVVPRAVLKGRTPDEVYFDRETDLPERLSALRREAQRKRVAYNQARRCDRCAPTVARNPVESQRHRKFDRSTA